MYAILIIGIVILVAIAFIIFKLVKSVAKTIFFVSSIVSLIIVIFAFFIISDAKDFKENFPAQPSLYLLEDEGSVLAGMSAIMTDEPKPDYSTKEEFASFQDNLDQYYF